MLPVFYAPARPLPLPPGARCRVSANPCLLAPLPAAHTSKLAAGPPALPTPAGLLTSSFRRAAARRRPLPARAAARRRHPKAPSRDRPPALQTTASSLTPPCGRQQTPDARHLVLQAGRAERHSFPPTPSRAARPLRAAICWWAAVEPLPLAPRPTADPRPCPRANAS